MYALFINISVRNWHFTAEERIAMRFLIEAVYCMTWIWTQRFTIIWGQAGRIFKEIHDY